MLFYYFAVVSFFAFGDYFVVVFFFIFADLVLLYVVKAVPLLFVKLFFYLYVLFLSFMSFSSCVAFVITVIIYAVVA